MLINENIKIRVGYLGTIEGKDMYDLAKNNPDNIISFFENMEPNEDKHFDMRRQFFKVNRNIKSYYIFARTDGVDVFVEMPLVMDTDLFKWAHRKHGRFHSLWTQLNKGHFRYNCTYDLHSDNTHVNVMYNNKIVESMYLNKADNNDILKAITEFEEKFANDVRISVERAISGPKMMFWS